MTMTKHIIFGVHITNRLEEASVVQKLLSEYGCNIKTRLGLHEVDEKFCAPGGILILEMYGDEKKCHDLAEKLNAVKGVEVQKMVFDHV